MATVTIRHLAQWKQAQERFAVLTAYDYSQARWLSQAGIPVALVGDSLGNVVLGHPTTLAVTMEDMLRHTAAVARGAVGCLVVADMPFLSYQISVEEAVRNAGRLLQAGAHAVKLEGGSERSQAIAAITAAGIPVMAHLGLTPQSVHQLGGFRTQAADAAGRRRLLRDAGAVEAAGAFSVVLEKVPAEAAADVTRKLAIPTIGCGAGPACDGQVLVSYDVLGMFPDFTPSFAKVYAELGKAAIAAMQAYAADVRTGAYPGRPAAGTAPAKRRKS